MTSLSQRRITDGDFKRIFLPINEWNIEAPSVDIYEEPIVYWKANIKWASIIEGFLLHLCENTAWKDAENENAPGPQAIMTYLQRTEVVEDLRFNPISCNLEMYKNGAWVVVPDWQYWLDCVPTGGGGGGGAAIGGATKNVALANNVTTSSLVFTRISAGSWTRTFTKSKALIQLALTASNSGAANSTIVRPHIQQGATSINGINLTMGVTEGTAQREIVVTDFFQNIAAGSATLEIEWGVSAGTGTINENYDVMWTVLEYDNLDELFQQDTRFLNGVIQKKIGGVWSNVVDIAALLAPIEAAAAAAQQSADNAQQSADAALAIAQSANNKANQALQENIIQDNRLDVLEADVTNIENQIVNINLTLVDYGDRITALENATPGFDAVWSQEFDFTTGDQDWGGGDGYSSGNGFVILSSSNELTYGLGGNINDAKITYVEITCRKLSGTSAQAAEIEFPIGSNKQHGRLPSAAESTAINWIQVNPILLPYQPSIKIQFPTGHSYYVEKMVVWGKGDNPF